MPTTPTIYFVLGDKGGSGKTTVAIALFDLLRMQDAALLVDTNSWPTSFEVAEQTHAALRVDDLRDLHRISRENQERHIVVDGRTHGLPEFEPLLQGWSDLPHVANVIWVLDRSEYSAERLRRLLDTTTTPVHALWNEHWLHPRFERQLSQASRSVASEALFPVVPDVVIDAIVNDQVVPEALIKSAPLGQRAALKKWRDEVAAAMNAGACPALTMPTARSN